MKKGQILEEVEIQGIAAEGKCLTRYQDRVIFVPGNQVAPGDIVDLRIVKKRKSYLEALPTRYHRLSELRQSPFCDHFGTCGGCKWQHLPYSQQLLFKQQQVEDQLKRIGHLALPPILPIEGADPTQYYRNKLEFTFSNRRWYTNLERDQDDFPPDALGFHIPGRFDKILDIEHCYLQADPSNKIRLVLRDYARKHQLSFYDAKEQIGYLRNVVIRSSNQDHWMVIMLVKEDLPQVLEPLLEHLQKEVPEITSLYYIINPKRNDSYQDLAPVLFSGEAFMEEAMEDLRFRVGPLSFFQTNSTQALRLYQITREFADIQSSDRVYDLYTGTGTIANFVARHAQEVIGLEYVEAAVADARTNSLINGIENTRFFAGDMKDLLKTTFLEAQGFPQVVICDPPRAGMHADVVHTLAQTGARRIVYVSCNPATQARDLALLDELYQIEAIQPVDMFPHTHHVENVVKLLRRPDTKA